VGHEGAQTAPGIDLYWLPLGAGGHCVSWNGRVYEALVARRERRARRSLFHAALEVRDDSARYVIEMGPVWNVTADDRGVVCEGPVGARWLGRWRWFRYEVRCWRDGCIPDADEAVGGPQPLSSDVGRSTQLLQLLPQVPDLTWGRDDQGLGEMWNSNSLVGWLLSSTGHDMREIVPPRGGRAPGWGAGLALTSRQQGTDARRA
jgi:hypothetical protein